jgi:HEAT repeat protein
MRNLPIAILLSILSVVGLVAVTVGSAQQRPPPNYQGQPVGEWVKRLKANDVKMRSKAAAALVYFANEAKEIVVPALAGALKDEHAGVRNVAIIALSVIGPDAKDAVPALIAAFNDKDEFVQSNAVRAVGQIGPAAVPALIDVLRDKDSHMRRMAALGLGNMGPEAKAATSPLIGALKDEDSDVRSCAAVAFSKFDLDPKHAKQAVSVLIPLLSDNTAGTSASLALTKIGIPAVPALIAMLKGQEKQPWTAASTLESMGPLAKAAVPQLNAALRMALKNKNAWLVSGLVRALCTIGPDANESVPLLIETLNHPDMPTRQKAAEALGKIGPGHKEVVPALILVHKGGNPYVIPVLTKIGAPAVAALMDTLKVPDYALQYRTLRVLAGMGPQAKDAIPAIKELLSHAKPQVRGMAAVVIGMASREPKGPSITALMDQLKPPLSDAYYIAVAGWAVEALRGLDPVAVSPLVDMLHNRHLKVRLLAIEALAGMGTDAKAAVPALAKALQAKDVEESSVAAFALAQIGPAETDAVAALIEAIGHQDQRRAFAAVWALNAIGPNAKAAVPALLNVLKNKKAANLHSHVAVALAEIAPNDERALAALVAVVNDLDEFNSADAPEELRKATIADVARAVGKCGPKAKAAVPGLLNAFRLPNADYSIAEALGDIGPDAKEAVPTLVEMVANSTVNGMPEATFEAAIKILRPTAAKRAPN